MKKLIRLRAGERLQRYYRYAGLMSTEKYVDIVSNGIVDHPTLKFQLKRGFHVIAILPDSFPATSIVVILLGFQ